MRTVPPILTSRPFLTFVGAAGLAALVWFLGPLVGLEGVLTRLGVGAAPFLAWGGWMGWERWRKAKAERTLSEGITSTERDEERAALEETAALSERFRKAIELLKKTQGATAGGRGLHEIPWYIVIGPPGSGKTTALVNSGLRFPLAGEMGQAPLRGIGGTRLCDWWFTEEAVLIDTAGRYTTQDSHAAIDQAGWRQFLDLLKTHRPRQPINGAIVAISMTDLAERDPTERMAHAQAVRLRLRELTEQFGVRFPIYVLFTKTDLLAGFVEFFDDVTKEGREQAFGMTFPFDDGGAEEGGAEEGVVGRFGEEFDLLVDGLNRRVVDRMQAERDVPKRGLIFGFPSQFASLKEPARAFLEEVFLPSRFEARPLLRGVYFTSGTQHGALIDRLMGTMANVFGLGRSSLRAFSGQGRSYFILRPLRDVFFQEASVVGTDAKLERRQRRVRRVSFAALVLATVGIAGVWTAARFDNQRLVDDFERAAKGYGEAASGLPARITDGDPRAVLPALDRARSLPAGYETIRNGGAEALDFGFYQGRKLAMAGQSVYHRALAGFLQPRLVVRLHQRLVALVTAEKPDVDAIERILRLYLSLSGNGAIDAAETRAWLIEDLAAAGYDAATAERVALHLDALFERPLRSLEIAQPLVERARAALREVSPAARAYALMRANAVAVRLPPWRPADHGGADLERVFTRKSNARMTEGIPGIYTFAGFQTVGLPGVPLAVRKVQDAAWVMGETGAAAGSPGALEGEVLALYLRDYAQRWDELLADMTLADVADLRKVAEQVNILSARASPLRQFLRAVAEQTTLARLPKLPGADEAAALPKEALIAGPLAQAAQIVDARFRLLNEFTVGAPGQPPRLDDLLKTLEAVFADLNRVQASRPGGVDPGAGAEAFVRLATEAAYLPVPVKTWMEQLSRRHTSIAVGGARAIIDSSWKTQVLPWCRKVVENRYPFVRTANSESAIGDFNRLFAPEGLIATFFETRLKPYVDTSDSVWRWQKVDGIDLGIPAAALAQFQLAARIRDAFFADGGREASTRVDFRASGIEAGAEQLVLTVDGQAMVFPRGGAQAFSAQWPKPGGPWQVLVTFIPVAPPPPPTGSAPATSSPATSSPATPAPASAVAAAPPIPRSVSYDGPWSLLRLIEAGRGRRLTDATRFTFGVSDGAFHATIEMRAASTVNPFTLSELRDFRCPDQF